MSQLAQCIFAFLILLPLEKALTLHLLNLNSFNPRVRCNKFGPVFLEKVTTM